MEEQAQGRILKKSIRFIQRLVSRLRFLCNFRQSHSVLFMMVLSQYSVRIMHSMRELEDGRYNKVANIVRKYHEVPSSW